MNHIYFSSSAEDKGHILTKSTSAFNFSQFVSFSMRYLKMSDLPDGSDIL